MANKAKLTYSPNLYQPDALTALSDKQLRKEYSRLRSIARKRLERMDNTEWETTQVYKYNRTKYKPIKELKSERELRHLLSDVARFITSQRGSISGLKEERKQTIETLHDRGYEFVNEKNYQAFGEFMEYARTANIGRMRDSNQPTDFFEEYYENKGLRGKELEDAYRKWQLGQIKLEKVQNQNQRGSDQFRRAKE